MEFAFGYFRKNFGKKRIYADWAATTPLRREVKKSVENARKIWANPSAIYREGAEARKALEKMRAKSACVLGVKPEEVYFTSGGTESNVTIIHGVLCACLERSERSGVHVVTTAIEHSSVLETLKLFENRGVRVTYVLPGPDGVVRADEILSAVRPDTVLVTCMYVNNEIGTIQPVSKIGAGVRKIRAEKFGKAQHKNREGREKDSGKNNMREDDFENNALFPVFHVDTSQAPLWLSCEMEGLRADAMTLDAHKMRGPKGVGALIARRHVPWKPLMTGGGQERGRRPTSESLE
ncbi:MAG: aminotransferase class V-fold PLP-dependent enzyme, partial [Patescibacteria group bacterium]